MKLRSVTHALLIAGVAAFSTSSGGTTYVSVTKHHKPTRNILRYAKNSMNYYRKKTKGELKLK